MTQGNPLSQGRDWLENRRPPFDDESRDDHRVERVTRSTKKKTPAAPKPPPKPKGRLMTKTPVKTKSLKLSRLPRPKRAGQKRVNAKSSIKGTQSAPKKKGPVQTTDSNGWQVRSPQNQDDIYEPKICGS